jgi:hypothetical protein
MNLLRYLVVPLLVLSLAVYAKCPPTLATLAIKQANGQVVPQIPTGWSEGDGWVVEQYHYSTIYLGVGDTVIVTVPRTVCFASGEMRWNDQYMSPSNGSGSSSIFKCRTDGYYIGGSCDEGCIYIDLTIAPLGTASGPIVLGVTAVLGGATVSSTSNMMRTDLRTQGLLPTTEPYTALGYSYVGGQGGTLGNQLYTQNLVDWVIVELRSAQQPQVVVASRPAVLDKYGQVLDAGTMGAALQFDQPPGYYHVAIKHRNHLGIMTSAPILMNNGSRAIADFHFTSGIPTYGTEATQVVGIRRFLWQGNSTHTSGAQQIRYTGMNNDRDPILVRVGGTVPTNATAGYYLEDVNLDGVVKYTGVNNDRDPILVNIGGTVPTNVRTEQIP